MSHSFHSFGKLAPCRTAQVHSPTSLAANISIRARERRESTFAAFGTRAATVQDSRALGARSAPPSTIPTRLFLPAVSPLRSTLRPLVSQSSSCASPPNLLHPRNPTFPGQSAQVLSQRHYFPGKTWRQSQSFPRRAGVYDFIRGNYGDLWVFGIFAGLKFSLYGVLWNLGEFRFFPFLEFSIEICWCFDWGTLMCGLEYDVELCV